MSAPRCNWSWMAEALDDGRLREEERASFERHASACATCRSAAGQVARLRERMAALPQPIVNDFEHRRERDRLLGRAAGLTMKESRRVAPVRLGLAFGAVLIVVAGAAGVRTIAHRLNVGSGAVSSVPPRYEVTALSHAAWSTEEIGATARISLSRGSAAFHVHRLTPGQTFLVALPDGEIEVRGTRFVVDVEEGHTRYVVVIEGKVALRRAGAPEGLLLGGERWDAPALAAARPAPAGKAADAGVENTSLGIAKASVSAARAGAAVETSISAAVPPARSRKTKHHSAAAVKSRGPAPSPDVSASAVEEREVADEIDPGRDAERLSGTASTLFARAIHAFHAGRYDEAEALWREFLSRHPDDARAEDAAFLRIVGRTRAGDRSGAARMARDYLAQFPHGMRRHEAELVSRQAP